MVSQREPLHFTGVCVCVYVERTVASQAAHTTGERGDGTPCSKSTKFVLERILRNLLKSVLGTRQGIWRQHPPSLNGVSNR